MKRHQSLIPLSREHHHGLIAAQFCKKNSPAYKKMPSDPHGKRNYILAYGENELLSHLKVEEESLIPMLTGMSEDLDKLITRVLDEHDCIRQLIRELETTSDVEEAVDNLGKAIDRHIRFEEREWFHNIQKLTDESLLNEIGSRINSSCPIEKVTNF